MRCVCLFFISRVYRARGYTVFDGIFYFDWRVRGFNWVGGGGWGGWGVLWFRSG